MLTEYQKGKRDIAEWIEELRNQQTGTIVIVQSRIHQDDLVGTLLETGEWEHLNLLVEELS